MHKKLKSHLQEFIFFAHKMAQYGLVRCGSGNLSYRIDPEKLASAVVDVIDEHELILLKNHGQIVVGKDFNETLQRAVYFEFASEILLRGGSRIDTLSKDALEYLHSARKKSEQSDI